MHTGNIVKAEREKRGLNQKQFSDLICGWSQSMVSQIEAAESMNTKSLEKIADAFEVPVWKLLKDWG